MDALSSSCLFFLIYFEGRGFEAIIFSSASHLPVFTLWIALPANDFFFWYPRHALHSYKCYVGSQYISRNTILTRTDDKPKTGKDECPTCAGAFEKCVPAHWICIALTEVEDRRPCSRMPDGGDQVFEVDVCGVESFNVRKQMTHRASLSMQKVLSRVLDHWWTEKVGLAGIHLSRASYGMTRKPTSTVSETLGLETTLCCRIPRNFRYQDGTYSRAGSNAESK